MDSSGGEKIHSMIADGIFYPNERSQAESELRSLGLDRESGGSGFVVVAPHSAWNLSGAIAAAAFLKTPAAKTRNGFEISQIVLLGAIHGSREEGIFVSDSDCFETPLGRLPVNRELCDEVVSCSTLFEMNDIPHLREHTTEILLPFIKYRFPQASLVPILLGGARPVFISTLAKTFRVVFNSLKKSTLFVIASNAAKHSDETKAQDQAKEFIKCLEEKKGEGLFSGYRKGRVSACGAPLVASVMESGLMDGARLSITPNSMSHAREDDNTIYYAGAVYESAEGP